MTTITLPRAVVEQALEALESDPVPLNAINNACAFLRAALAQQAESPCACWPGRMCRRQAQCAATVRAQQAEPLTIYRLRDALVASRIIPPAAVEDPEEYDDGVTLHRIEALHRRIT